MHPRSAIVTQLKLTSFTTFRGQSPRIINPRVDFPLILTLTRRMLLHYISFITLSMPRRCVVRQRARDTMLVSLTCKFFPPPKKFPLFLTNDRYIRRVSIYFPYISLHMLREKAASFGTLDEILPDCTRFPVLAEI